MSALCDFCLSAKTQGIHESSFKLAENALAELQDTLKQCDEYKHAAERKLDSPNDGSLLELKEKYFVLQNKIFQLKRRIHASRLAEKNQNEENARLEHRIEGLRSKACDIERYGTDLNAAKETLQSVLNAHTKELYFRRIERVLTVFKTMPIEASSPPRSHHTATAHRKSFTDPHNPVVLGLSGHSSILSMPLPNNGNFSGVPVDALSAALSHIAHLVDAVAGIMNIALPHPLQPFEASDCLISAQHDLQARAQVRACCHSLYPVTHLHDRSHHRDFDWTRLSELTGLGAFPTGPTQPAGTAAQTAERFEAPVVLKQIPGEARPREYAINPSFPTALVLLQADVVALCLGAGLQAEDLWPAEAMLLNLHLLQRHCAGIAHRLSPVYAHAEQSSGDLPEERPVVYYRDCPAASQVQDVTTLATLINRYGSAPLETIRIPEHVLAERIAEGPLGDVGTEASALDKEDWDVVTLR